MPLGSGVAFVGSHAGHRHSPMISYIGLFIAHVAVTMALRKLLATCDVPSHEILIFFDVTKMDVYSFHLKYRRIPYDQLDVC